MIEVAVRTVGCNANRAGALVEVLQSLCPTATGCGVMLRDGAGRHAIALDSGGNALPQWEAALRDDKTPTGSVDHVLQFDGQDFGRLAIGPDDENSRVVLAFLAPLASAHLGAAALSSDLLVESIRADIGELAGPLMHDVTNAFNNLQLNLMVLEQGAGDLSVINFGKLRSRMEQVTALVREVQAYRGRPLRPVPPPDLNDAAREAASLLVRDFPDPASAAAAVELQLAAAAIPVVGARTDLVRCLLLLLKNGLKAKVAGARPPRLRTDPSGAAQIEVPGLIVPVDAPLRLYDTLQTVCPTVSALELATAKSIARRFNGKLSAACPSEGLILRLEV